MPAKDRKKGKNKEQDQKKAVKVEDNAIEQAKANASLWEARLEVTELSRIEYRDTSRRLAKNNEDLKKQQYKLEKDTMSVLSYLKKQDQEKDNMIEKLKQQLAETKEKAKEEKEKLEQKYSMQVSELEGQFHQKAKEIGMIQTELKTIKQFQKRKIQVEKELEDVSFCLFMSSLLKKRFIFILCVCICMYVSSLHAILLLEEARKRMLGPLELDLLRV